MSRPVHRLVLGALLALASLTALGADKGQQRLIGFNADFITQGVPTTMVAGQSYAVSVTMSNNGSDGYDWYDAALESQNPTGNTTWGLSQVPVGTSVPPGYDHIFNFTVVAPSTPGTYNFQWRMRVISGSLRFGDLTPNVAVVVTPPNQLPTVNLTAPSNGASYTTGQAVAMAATASDSDGTINRVEFLVDGAEVGQDTTSPYTYSWTSTTGTHTVQARAVDNQSGTKTTTAINITVTPPNQLPTVSLTAPSNGASYTTGQAVAMAATASDSDGTINRVEFLVDGAEVGQDTTSPYSYSWASTTGAHTVQARAVDNQSGTKTTTAINITVTPPNQLPTVSLTAPSSGASYTTGQAVAMAATASDSDGSINRVEFLIDGTEVGQDTTSPYTYNWTSTTGAHTVQARAVDNQSGTKTTTAINITVTPPNQLPTVSLTAPSSGASYTTGQAVAMAATASDSDGSINRVEFLVDGAEVGQDTTSPYTYNWTSTTGAHTVQARAVDNQSGTKTTTAINITVTSPNQLPTVSLTAPSNGASYTVGDTVTFSATASDSDGTINRVEFFVDGVEVTQDTTSPYSKTWIATAGNHTLKARAWDDDNAYKDSTSRTISVTAPPPEPASITRTYRYNSYQELCAVDEPETGTTLMGYDAAGNLAWSASGLSGTPACSTTGNTTAILSRKVVRTYDARNRIDTLTFPDNNGNQAWDYTPDGLPESITTYNDGGASSVINSYLYNKRRLPVSETLQADTYTWTVGYAYTGNGHLASLTYPDSLSVDYAPNALGQPQQAGSYATNVTYYPNGAIAGFTYGNGIVHTLTQNTRGLPERSRDANGSTAIHDDSYDYDANGNVLAISDGVAGHRGDRDMVYDGLDRLVQATSPMFGTATYTYDAVDNLTHLQVTGGSQPRNHDYCYDDANQLTNVMTGGCSGGTSVIGLGYDVQGNLANKNGVTYTFDYGNRLRTGGPETYRYDAHGRRVRSSSSAGLAYSFYSQSGQILFQRDERSSKRRQYIYLGGSLVAERSRPIGSSTETVTYQHTDALGSPVATTDSAKTVLQRSEYEPYGFLANRPMQDGLGYTGHITDAATGLVYMQQRYYDPMIPRFLSVDPVTAYSDPIGAFNRYRYANSNPFRFTDPDGRASWDDVKNFFKGVAIQVADSMLEEAHYTSVNQSVVEAYPGELSVAGQCGCEYQSPFPAANTNEEQLGRDMAPAVTISAALVTGKFLGKAADGVASTASKGLGGNPFKGKSSEQIAEMLTNKGYEPRGPNPTAGQGTFLNPSTGRSVHIDADHPPPKPPHVGVQRPRGNRELPPREYPLE